MSYTVEELKRIIFDNYQSTNYKVDKIFEYLEEIRQNRNTNIYEIVYDNLRSYIENLSLNDLYKLIYNKHLAIASKENVDKYETLLKLYDNDYYRTVKDIENAK